MFDLSDLPLHTYPPLPGSHLIAMVVMLDFLWVDNRAFGAHRAFILCYFKRIIHSLDFSLVYL